MGVSIPGTVPGTAADTSLSKGPFRAPRGTAISCKGWQQEAALRMLLNNLDPEVAEKPEDLVVYGGTGKAARNWECFHAIVRSLKALEADETLLVQSGKPVAGCCCAIRIWWDIGTTGTAFMNWTARD